jgi:ABC-type nitrate/sulfonate/bicarbonate transport system permease component
MRVWAALLPPSAAILVLLAVWQIATVLLGVPDYILPGPIAIVGAIGSSSGILGSALAVTVEEAMLGFAIGAVLAILLAIFMVLAPPVERALIPVVVALNAVPAVAFVPLALIWFGLGIWSKVGIAALSVNLVVLLNALGGLKTPDVLWRLRLPAAMPAIVTGLRIGLPRSTIAVIVAEMLGAYTGIGQIIYQSTAQVDYLTVWAAVLVAMIASLLLYAILVVIDRRLVWWS